MSKGLRPGLKRSACFAGLIIALALLCASCRPATKANGVNSMASAKLLAIYDREGFDDVIVASPSGEVVARYALVPRADSLPASLPEDAVVIRTPLRSLVVDSEVYASALELLGAEDVITGLFDAGYATSPSLVKGIAEGRIVDVGQSVAPNGEKILALHPDALMLGYYEGMELQDVDRYGVPVLKMYDLQESTPLGRAEWLRYIGRLVGRSEAADSVFAEVKGRYEALAEQGRQVPDSIRPKVLTETVWQGSWSVPGPASYPVRFISDAGGRYFISSDSPLASGAVTLNLLPEQVLAAGGDADVWLIKFYGSGPELRSLLQTDPVYSDIKALREGRVYFSDTSRSGLFREFPFQPDLLLQDYRVILSGDSVSPLRYFQRL